MMTHSTPLTENDALSYLLDMRPEEAPVSQHTLIPPAQAETVTDYLLKQAAAGQWQTISQPAIISGRFPDSSRHLFLDELLIKAHDPRQLFHTIHERLTDKQYFAFRVRTAENIKSRMLQKFPGSLFWFYYPFHFMGRRVLPKMMGLVTVSRLLRVPVDMSKSEIMGRLIYHGFEIVEIKESARETIFVTRRHMTSNPSATAPLPSEGILFRMQRVGKGGKPIKVYKFRSMHPYAEYAQEYVHKMQGLDAGGKFKDDFRVSTGGRLIRKYWIDELPMLFNLLKGDIKLIGVRPISDHYFSLYPEQVRPLRTRHKPGLLPPFYADLPNTFEEIVASEVKYLEAYEKAPLKTDMTYLGRILKNIFINKARSK